MMKGSKFISLKVPQFAPNSRVPMSSYTNYKGVSTRPRGLNRPSNSPAINKSSIMQNLNGDILAPKPKPKAWSRPVSVDSQIQIEILKGNIKFLDETLKKLQNTWDELKRPERFLVMVDNLCWKLLHHTFNISKNEQNSHTTYGEYELAHEGYLFDRFSSALQNLGLSYEDYMLLNDDDYKPNGYHAYDQQITFSQLVTGILESPLKEYAKVIEIVRNHQVLLRNLDKCDNNETRLYH